MAIVRFSFSTLLNLSCMHGASHMYACLKLIPQRWAIFRIQFSGLTVFGVTTSI